ncbi:MAG: hypothetical protein M5U26_01290 [Planctomycetota bacterium]|nr:hypothetical protein [Planctomycetota bacterium]
MQEKPDRFARSRSAWLLPGLVLLAGMARGGEDSLSEMRKLVQTLVEQNRAQQEAIAKLTARMSTYEAAATRIAPRSPAHAALDDALAELERPAAAAGASASSGKRDRYIDISANLLLAAGTSTEDEDAIQSLQGGAHDPKKRGFTLQQLELSFSGAVDPYFRAESHIIYAIDALSGESVVELEEAFVTTTNLPLGMELEAGQFFTEFGRLNPVHPHAWDWLDQPAIHSRVFGGDGMRAPGVRLGWLLPTSWFSQIHLGVQNANGETMPSFLGEQPGGGHGHGEEEEGGHLEEGIGGRPIFERRVRNFRDLAYLGRWENGTDLSDELNVLFGMSGLYGPNHSGPNAATWIGGADFTLKWRPSRNERGYPFLTWQSEFVYRRFQADGTAFLDAEEDPPERVPLAGDTLTDWGLYTQVLWGFKRDWAIGARFEYATGAGRNVEFEEDPDPEFVSTSRRFDSSRDERYRVAPLLVWRPSEFSRLRFQYNYDRATHLDGRGGHSFWLGLDVLWGVHPAHRY